MIRKTILLGAMLTSLTLLSCSQKNESSVGTRTAALPDEAWAASDWISVKDAPVVTGLVGDTREFRAAEGSNWFVAPIKNDKKVYKAVWMTTGLGVYELYVNGKTVGTEVLKPGFTHYGKTKISYTYDITDLIDRDAFASNVFSVQVTPGWWADKIVTPYHHDGMVGKKCAFRGVLELSFRDGTKQLIGTDTTLWKAGIAGPVKLASIFDGEVYDARELPGWETPEKLSTPEINDEFTGTIFPSAGAEIYLRKDLTLKPIDIYIWKGIENASENEYGKVIKLREYKDGQTIILHEGETLVADFGQNAAAVPAFKFRSAAGTTLTCLPGELLNDGNGAKSRGMDGPEGSVHRTNLRIHEEGVRLEYTFAETPDYAYYYPHCTFFGYRFISVTATEDVEFASIESIPVTSIAKEIETGTIVTGDSLINKLISNTIWGQRSNYLSVPTDCPQRNERLGWTADTQVFTETGTFFANTLPFFHKWTRDLRDSQAPLGGFPGVAPDAMGGGGPGAVMRLGWADAGIIVPWTVWKQFGDKSIIDENWAAMDKFMKHINDTKYDHATLVKENDNYQWADWLSYEALESCSGRSHITDASGRRQPSPDAITYWSYLGASYWAIDAAHMADMAKATGRHAFVYENMVKEAKDYLRENFFNEDGTFKLDVLNTMQTPALFALKNQLFDGEAKEAMIARLRENFAQHENCLQTGFLGTSILMETLTKNGMADIAYELLFQRKNPSWLYSVDNGATTIWERWNSYTIENGMGPKGMNSFNHYAYGCVCAWIWKCVAGISTDISQPGFKHIILQPVPSKRLGSIDATYNSASGPIHSDWHYEGDTWVWHFTIPAGTTATVIVPGCEPEEKPEGSYEIVKEL